MTVFDVHILVRLIGAAAVCAGVVGYLRDKYVRPELVVLMSAPMLIRFGGPWPYLLVLLSGGMGLAGVFRVDAGQDRTFAELLGFSLLGVTVVSLAGSQAAAISAIVGAMVVKCLFVWKQTARKT